MTDIMRIRNIMKETSQKRFMELYKNPLYNSKTKEVKEVLKERINIYKLINCDLSWFFPKKFSKLKNSLDSDIRGVLSKNRYINVAKDIWHVNITKYNGIELALYIEAKATILNKEPRKFYLENYNNFIMEKAERVIVEEELGLRYFKEPFKYEIYDMPLCDIYNYLDEIDFKKLVSLIDDRYNIDIYSLISTK